MSNIYLEVVAPKPKLTHIQVHVSYSKGGASAFGGGSSRRGLYVHVTPVGLEEWHGRTMVHQALFKGCKLLLREMGRANQKQEEECRADVAAMVQTQTGVVWEMVRRVCAEEGVSIVGDYRDETVAEPAAATSTATPAL